MADDVWEIISDNAETLDECIMHERDYNYSYFGFKTLCKSYLVSINDKIIERPQYMLMRVAIGIHKRNIDAAIETYAWMYLFIDNPAKVYSFFSQVVWLFHSRNSHTLQCRHTKPSDVLMLFTRHEGRQH